MDKGLNREVSDALKGAASEVVTRASTLAPRRSGRLAGSLRPFAAGLKAGVRSPLPYANVVHWGGTIRPKGAPVHFRRRPFIEKAAEERADRVLEKVADNIEALATRHGWH
jgi:phage gpG-like protein